MPKVQPEYLEQRRRQIIDAAAACFARAGFHQTSMQDICTEANLSPGAVYRYFKGKSEIIQAMTALSHQEDTRVMQETMAVGSMGQIIEKLADLYLVGTQNLEQCALNIELLAESRRDPIILDSMRQGVNTICASLEHIVRQAQERGEMPDAIDPVAMSKVMMGLYQGVVWQRLMEPDFDSGSYAQVVKALFAGILTSPEAEASPTSS